MHKLLSRNGKGHYRSQYDLAADFENIKEALTDASSDVKGRVNEILLNSLKDMKSKSTDFQETIADYVAEKPFKSIGIAVLSGLILGYLLRRK